MGFKSIRQSVLYSDSVENGTAISRKKDGPHPGTHWACDGQSGMRFVCCRHVAQSVREPPQRGLGDQGPGRRQITEILIFDLSRHPVRTMQRALQRFFQTTP